MRSRHLLAVLLTIACAGVLAACGEEEPTSTRTTRTTQTTAQADATATATAQAAAPTGPSGATGPTGSTGPTGADAQTAQAADPAAADGEIAPPARDADDEAAPAAAEDDPLAGVTFFSDDSPWNQRVDNLPVDPNSRSLLELAKIRPAAIETQDGLDIVDRRIEEGVFINTEKFTPPIYTNREGSPVTIICRQRFCGPDAGVRTITIPDDAEPDPAYDGWFTAINLDTREAVDLWRARREGNVISYQYIRKWDLDGAGFGPPIEQDLDRAYSARGSGLPLFAGAILPSELRAGRIDHALSISVPAPASREYVQPASVTDGQGSQNGLPEGARLRLRADAELQDSGEDADGRRSVEELLFDVTLNPLGLFPEQGNRLVHRSAEIIEEALRTYGAIVVDRSAVPTLYAQRNGDFRGLLRGDEVESIDLEDFEVIELGRRLEDPPPDQITDPAFADLAERSAEQENQAIEADREDVSTDFLGGESDSTSSGSSDAGSNSNSNSTSSEDTTGDFAP